MAGGLAGVCIMRHPLVFLLRGGLVGGGEVDCRTDQCHMGHWHAATWPADHADFLMGV